MIINLKELIRLCKDEVHDREYHAHHARTDAKLKRAAIEAASREIVPPEEALWDYDEDLKSWLKRSNKR